MATKKQKEFWYVLVLTEIGPRFITSVNFSDKTAEWKELEKPEELSVGWAKDLCLGLNWNGWLAYPICSQWEIDKQPYRYDVGHFEWIAGKAGE